MSTLNKLYDYIDKQNIVLRYVNGLEKKHDLTGIYASEKNKHIILLDENIIKDKYLHVNVLAEECGHYATSFGNSIKTITNNNYKKIVQKEERKANKWKCSFIIPDEILKDLLRSCDSIFEIAEELDIDTELVLDRLEYIALTTNTYKVNDNLYIDLLKLPNLVKIEI